MGAVASTKTLLLGIVLSVLAVQLFFVTASVPTVSAQEHFFHASGTEILDGSGRSILLRGVNYYGYECANMPNEMHREADYAKFASVGFNVVRLPVGWMWFEPRPGVFDSSYLNIVNQDIQWAKEYGLYVILDMHQNFWSPRFPNTSDGTNGCGAPYWAVAQYPATNLGRLEAIENFWINDTLQTHYAEVWKKLASTYATDTTVAGYDIMNEPPDPADYNWVNPSLTLNSSLVASFYLRVITWIRSVDTNHLIFLEPTTENALPQGFVYKEQVVWSPHFYPLAFNSHYSASSITVLRNQLARDYDDFALANGTPIWIGEYGAFMTDSTYLIWLQDSVTLFKQYDVGSAWWPYHGGIIQQIPAPVIQY